MDHSQLLDGKIPGGQVERPFPFESGCVCDTDVFVIKTKFAFHQEILREIHINKFYGICRSILGC